MDAVCINQDDAQKKSKQVALMGRIYMQASRTVVYLGKGDRNSTYVVELFKRPLRESADEHFFSRPAWKEFAGFVLPGYFDKRANRHWAGIMSRMLEFFERPWFTRTWTIQEVLLSNSSQI